MYTLIKQGFLFYMFTLVLCFNSFILLNTSAQVNTSASDNYTFETINVPGVDFLALTASSDFEDYAGNTPSADGEKMIGFTLIDGVFTTHVSRVQRTLISMPWVIMVSLQDTTKIARVSTTVSS
ncbi:MAG: hypothetical protein OXD54_05295 [Candidatus Poribacteria bacterium]|nr:hypothetical protein [Candidatus Poribacteria bacterium]